MLVPYKKCAIERVIKEKQGKIFFSELVYEVNNTLPKGRKLRPKTIAYTLSVLKTRGEISFIKERTPQGLIYLLRNQ